MKRLFKNKKGSILVEKILMTAFAVAAGGAVVVYGSNVITNAKNTQIAGILGQNGVQEGTEHQTSEQISAHFNDTAKTISFSTAELNNRSFTNLKNKLEELVIADEIWSIYNTTISYGGQTFIPDETTFGTCFLKSDNYDICISTPGYTEFYPEGPVDGNKFNYYICDEPYEVIIPFENGIV